MYAATQIAENAYWPVEGMFGEKGTEQALADFVGGTLSQVFIVSDDDEVLASGWYDAAGDESAEEFARRMFSEASA